MLKLLNIKKDYISGNKYSKKAPLNVVEALKDINLEFRENEFVAILGPSGGGKTTLLNVIGGLDQYTDGELYINEQSTKHFSDYEWDRYRNGQIGFIFQNYNLIMHQTVLSNVEMALTLIGLSKADKKKRAVAALESVGLGDQLNKNPNQLSGGQMQRVAIARAIINNPKIILADEPTGALDSEASVQVMEILKNLSKDRLVIMVTHNGELANKYANRIVRLVDGKVVSDTNPYISDFKENMELVETSQNPFIRLSSLLKRRKKRRASLKTPHMTYQSAFKLSLSNLNTKKTRTTLTSFAGSIGIIGIALILAISSGFNNYIHRIEESALSSYPLVVEKQTFSLPSIYSMLGRIDQLDKEKYPDSNEASVGKVLSNLLSNLGTVFAENDLESFKTYVDENFDDSYGSVKYNYRTKLNIYSNFFDPQDYNRIHPFDDLMGNYIPEALLDLMPKVKEMAGGILVWEELISNQKLLEEQYDLVGGEYGSRWPEDKTEVVLVLDEYNQITDFMLLAIGLEPPENALKVFTGDEEIINKTYNFEDLIGLKYKALTSADYYYYDEDSSIWKVHNDNTINADYIEANSLTLEIVGIVRPNEKSKSTSVNGAIGYTKELSDYLIRHAAEHPAVLAQEASPDKNIIDGSNISKAETLDEILAGMGKADIDKPESISFYVSSFETKDKIIDFIESYNDANPEKTIKYTDTLGAMMASVNEISGAITRVLLAFSAISLIVSSIMIGIITYISVLERTKEIGILRSLGARKKDISRVFSSETMLIGLISGIMGVGITYILTIPINALLENALGITGIASFVWWHALILIGISIGLTVISGSIPSYMASKKDPVKALRSE